MIRAREALNTTNNVLLQKNKRYISALENSIEVAVTQAAAKGMAQVKLEVSAFNQETLDLVEKSLVALGYQFNVTKNKMLTVRWDQ